MPINPQELEHMLENRGGSAPPFCVSCGYNLTGAVSSRCPECGCRFVGAEWRDKVEEINRRLYEARRAHEWLRPALGLAASGIGTDGRRNGYISGLGCFSRGPSTRLGLGTTQRTAAIRRGGWNYSPGTAGRRFGDRCRLELQDFLPPIRQPWRWQRKRDQPHDHANRLLKW